MSERVAMSTDEAGGWTGVCVRMCVFVCVWVPFPVHRMDLGVFVWGQGVWGLLLHK